MAIYEVYGPEATEPHCRLHTDRQERLTRVEPPDAPYSVAAEAGEPIDLVMSHYGSYNSYYRVGDEADPDHPNPMEWPPRRPPARADRKSSLMEALQQARERNAARSRNDEDRPVAGLDGDS